jgi:Restriction endonuclease
MPQDSQYRRTLESRRGILAAFRNWSLAPPAGSPLRMGLWLATTILSALISVSLLFRLHPFRGDLSLGEFIEVLVIGPWVLGACVGFYGFLGSVENKIKIAISPSFRRASQFRSAMDAYRKNAAKYEQWIAEQQKAYWRGQEAFWRGLSGVGFERELARLFRRLGYQVSETPQTGDGGVDLILRRDGRVTVVQCKAHDKKIPIGVARELIASMQDFHAHDAIIACLEGVTKPVQQYIATKPIRIIDVRDILSLQKSLN